MGWSGLQRRNRQIEAVHVGHDDDAPLTFLPLDLFRPARYLTPTTEL
jgi:hypothetical protein